IDDLPDIAPYLPEDADVAEIGAEDTEVLAEIDDDLDSDDDPATGPGGLEASAGDDTGGLEAGAGDDSGGLEAGAGGDSGGEVGGQGTGVLAEVDDDLDSDDDPATGPGGLEASAGDDTGGLEAGAGDDSGGLEAGAGDDSGGEVGDQSAEMSRVDD